MEDLLSASGYSLKIMELTEGNHDVFRTSVCTLELIKK